MAAQQYRTKKGKTKIIQISNEPHPEKHPFQLCTLELANGEVVTQWVRRSNIEVVPKDEEAA